VPFATKMRCAKWGFSSAAHQGFTSPVDPPLHSIRETFYRLGQQVCVRFFAENWEGPAHTSKGAVKRKSTAGNFLIAKIVALSAPKVIEHVATEKGHYNVVTFVTRGHRGEHVWRQRPAEHIP